MPNKHLQHIRTQAPQANRETSGGRAQRSAAPGLWLIGIAAVVAVIAVAIRMRMAAITAWRSYARSAGMEFEAKDRYQPRYISGNLGERAVFVETATSKEEETPYFHTRASTPVRNPSGLVAGLRRKSVLEEAQTRKDLPSVITGDGEFDRRFLIVTSDEPALLEVLTPEMRKELLRYSDIELFIRPNLVEWRRAGTVADTDTLKRLNQLITGLATSVDALNIKAVTLTDRLEIEERIRQTI